MEHSNRSAAGPGFENPIGEEFSLALIALAILICIMAGFGLIVLPVILRHLILRRRNIQSQGAASLRAP